MARLKTHYLLKWRELGLVLGVNNKKKSLWRCLSVVTFATKQQLIALNYNKNHRSESFIEAKKRFSYLVTSKRKCACKKSAATLNIMDGSTVASSEKHKGMASGQSSSDCSAKKSYRDQEAPRGSKSGSPLQFRRF
uniref:Uncharacterized protein n=1 Tax=Oryza punctata TaxID=4537 RepID=A0A0E0MJW7_ORYPU